MHNIGLIGVLAATVMFFASTSFAGDWKEYFARKVVGHVVEEAIEEAVEDAALDRTLDTVARVAVRKLDIDDRDDIGEAVSDGIETAIRVADVADTLDDVSDAVRTINRIRKVIR
jgi:hypothetical protein